MTGPAYVRCQFFVRTPTGYGQWWYDRLGNGMSDTVPTRHPPALGDTVLLRRCDGSGDQVRTYVVMKRDWAYPMPGSTDWPNGKPVPDAGPRLALICDEAPGPFAHEADGPQP